MVGEVTVGSRVGDYQVTAAVGRGAQGRTWVGQHVGGTRVLLKQLHSLGADEVARFEREARILAELDDPRIPRLHGSFEALGSHWLAMELVRGCTLQAVLAHAGELSDDVAALVGCEVARALASAHAHPGAFVHRDVAPHNILISLEGEVKLTDFGLAGGRRERGELDEGLVHGRDHYIAPEYGRTGIDTALADVYSLGVVLFRCLASHYPVGGASLSSVLGRAEREERGHVEAERPGVDSALCELVDTMLSPAAGRRPTARAAADALEAYVTEGAREKLRDLVAGLAPEWADEPPAPPKWTRPGVLLALPLLALAVMAAGVWEWTVVRGEKARAAMAAVAPRSSGSPSPREVPAVPAPPDAGLPAPEPAESPPETPPAPRTAPARRGTLVIQRHPYASIYIDGDLHGREFAAGELVVRLSPGEHTIRAEGPPEVRGQRRVTVGAGRRRVVRFGR